MFGVLISYLPNFNVGQENGMVNATGGWNNGQPLQKRKKKTKKIALMMYFESICIKEK